VSTLDGFRSLSDHNLSSPFPGELLSLNDQMRPVLNSCENLFARGPMDRKGKSPAVQKPLPMTPTPAGSSSAATEAEETPLIRRKGPGEALAKPERSSPAATRTTSDEELASFLEEIDEAVASAPRSASKGKDVEESTDHVSLQLTSSLATS
jgi:hypothetical protein